MRKLILAVVTAAGLSDAANAEVASTGPQGFRLKIVRDVAAPPAKVYKSISEWGRWWSDAHTYSGKAANITLAMTPNGCLCETLPNGGGVRHGVVAALIPDRMVRMAADFGPLQDEGVSGAITFAIKPSGVGSTLTVTYNIGGARSELVEKAALIDGVITEGADRLKRYAETGAP